MDIPDRSSTSNVRTCNTHNHVTLGYPDYMFHAIGRMIPVDWKKLGIYLGIGYQVLESMINVKQPHEMAMEMLQTWWRSTDVHSRWGELHYALASTHRQDLLSLTKEFFKKHDMDFNNPDELLIARLFAILSDKTPRSWRDMATYLGLESERVRAIGAQPEQDTSQHTYRVLKMWQGLPRSTHHQLFRVLLTDMKRTDVAMYILERFEQDGRGSNVSGVSGQVVCDCDSCECAQRGLS